MRDEAKYLDPGSVLFGTVLSVLVGTLIDIFASSGKKEVAAMYNTSLDEGERRYGFPRSEEERATRHERLFPGTPLPPRGSRLFTGQEREGFPVLFEEGANPSQIYEEDWPYWKTYSRVPMEIVGRTPSQLAQALNSMERSINYGQKARVQLLTRTRPSQGDLNDLHAQMVSSGFHSSRPVGKIVKGIPCTEITLRKGSPVWAMLIPLIPTAIIGGLIAFGITRIETITKALLPLMLVTVGGMIVLVGLLTRKPALETARSIAERKYLTRTLPIEPKKALAASF